jgi:hypothetical protein
VATRTGLLEFESGVSFDAKAKINEGKEGIHGLIYTQNTTI